MMKKCKILGTAAAMMLVFALAGCENNTDDVDALKKRVDQMEQELADMEINNNLAESSQDKASINEVSASDDSIASLTQAVDDMVSKANEAKPDGTEEEKMEQFFTLKKEMKSMDSRLDAYEDYLEYQYRQENRFHLLPYNAVFKIESVKIILIDAVNKLFHIHLITCDQSMILVILAKHALES